jgi:hypothetical protein
MAFEWVYFQWNDLLTEFSISFRSYWIATHTNYIHRPDCLTPSSRIGEFNVLEEHTV